MATLEAPVTKPVAKAGLSKAGAERRAEIRRMNEIDAAGEAQLAAVNARVHAAEDAVQQHEYTKLLVARAAARAELDSLSLRQPIHNPARQRLWDSWTDQQEEQRQRIQAALKRMQDMLQPDPQDSPASVKRMAARRMYLSNVFATTIDANIRISDNPDEILSAAERVAFGQGETDES